MTAPCCSLRVLIVMVALVALPAPRAVGQDTSRLTFNARVSDLCLQDGSRAKNKHRDDCVEVALPGRLDSQPLAIPLIERKAADWSTPERALASIRSANTVGQKEWLVENFTADERPRVRAELDDPAMVKRSVDYYTTIRKAEITGSAELRGYTLVFTREETSAGTVRIVPVTLRKTASGWKQTNALSADETFDVVWAALRTARTDGRTLGAC